MALKKTNKSKNKVKEPVIIIETNKINFWVQLPTIAAIVLLVIYIIL